MHIVFFGSLNTNSSSLDDFDARNDTLFQVKVFVKKIKENALGRYFVKVTAYSSFK